MHKKQREDEEEKTDWKQWKTGKAEHQNSKTLIAVFAEYEIDWMTQ